MVLSQTNKQEGNVCNLAKMLGFLSIAMIGKWNLQMVLDVMIVHPTQELKTLTHIVQVLHVQLTKLPKMMVLVFPVMVEKNQIIQIKEFV